MILISINFYKPSNWFTRLISLASSAVHVDVTFTHTTLGLQRFTADYRGTLYTSPSPENISYSRELCIASSQVISDYCDSKIGIKYGWADLFLYPFRRFSKKDHSGDMCSESVAELLVFLINEKSIILDYSLVTAIEDIGAHNLSPEDLLRLLHDH